MSRAAGRSIGRATGFTLLEMIVAVILIAILSVVGIARLLAVREEAERVAMENVLGALRSALQLRAAAEIAQNRHAAVAALPGTNPVNQLAEIPANYLGELDAPDPAAIEGGRWYFDRAARLLVYRVASAERFTSALAGPPRVRFGIELLYEDRNANGRYDHPADRFEGLRLAPREPYAWAR